MTSNDRIYELRVALRTIVGLARAAHQYEPCSMTYSEAMELAARIAQAALDADREWEDVAERARAARCGGGDDGRGGGIQ